MSETDGFLARWARRKAQAREGDSAPDAQATPPVKAPAPVEAPPAGAAAAPARLQARALSPLPPQPEATPTPKGSAPPDRPPEPPPSLQDVALLTRDSDYSRFVAPGVDGTVRNAAMKKLFSDPHFNVMDGLDTYIDDYGKPDPIPESMLRLMRQSKFLGLFDVEDGAEDAAGQGAKDEAGESQPPGAVSVAGPAPLATPAHSEPATREETEEAPDEDTDLRLQQDHAAGRPGPDQGAGA
jgi:hypothetical protein